MPEIYARSTEIENENHISNKNLDIKLTHAANPPVNKKVLNCFKEDSFKALRLLLKLCRNLYSQKYLYLLDSNKKYLQSTSL